mgnify:CR=1 FL=1
MMLATVSTIKGHPNMSLRINHLLTIFLSLCLSMSLVSCDKSPEKTVEKAKPILVLNDSNIKQFTQALHKDYVDTQKALLDSFYSHKKADDAHGFTEFRNYNWTPAFIVKKDYYQAVLDKNRSYVTRKAIKPAFLRFENLIYIGLNLKNGLLENDQEMIEKALAEAKADKKLVEFVAKSS